MKSLIDKLVLKKDLPKGELKFLLENLNDEIKVYLIEKSDQVRRKAYGDKVFMRGLIEISSYCERNCMYCGIRKDNKNAQRYRLTEEDIIMCCDEGYRLGYRTFVLQGGEDGYFDDERVVRFIGAIKTKYPDTRVTLSLGEKTRASYESYFKAGADRYLLRHETASKKLYRKLHPDMSYENRVQCLYNLKDIGYQVGAGFMIGIPGQKTEDFINDLKFLKILEPHMIGIGPFIPHKDTAFRNFPHGSLEMTETLLAIIRIMLPDVLLPATTALGSIDGRGRERGLRAGANVVMPNLSPVEVREKYSLYDGKICTGDEAAHCRKCIEGRISSAGYKVDMDVGDNFLWRDRR